MTIAEAVFAMSFAIMTGADTFFAIVSCDWPEIRHYDGYERVHKNSTGRCNNVEKFILSHIGHNGEYRVSHNGEKKSEQVTMAIKRKMGEYILCVDLLPCWRNTWKKFIFLSGILFVMIFPQHFFFLSGAGLAWILSKYASIVPTKIIFWCPPSPSFFSFSPLWLTQKNSTVCLFAIVTGVVIRHCDPSPIRHCDIAPFWVCGLVVDNTFRT